MGQEAHGSAMSVTAVSGIWRTRVRYGMGLIYVNRRGQTGGLWPLAVGIRETFRPGHEHVETAALIVGGHAPVRPWRRPGRSGRPRTPGTAPLEQMGLGWKSSYGTGTGKDTIASGIEGHGRTPRRNGQQFPQILYGYEVGADERACRRLTATAKGRRQCRHHPGPVRRSPGRSPCCTDLSLRVDPIYERITRR